MGAVETGSGGFGLVCRFRSVNSYSHLAPRTTAGIPKPTLDAEVADRARLVLDELDADEFRWLHECYQRRSAPVRALADIADVARDERTGPVRFRGAGPDCFGVLHEIASCMWLANERVLAARRDGIPGRRAVATIPR